MYGGGVYGTFTSPIKVLQGFKNGYFAVFLFNAHSKIIIESFLKVAV